jgi:hypothetical protein
LPGALLNVVVLVVDTEELTAMHQRDWIYDARVVTASLRDVVIEGGDAVMYVARPEYVVHAPIDARVAAVRASYLRIVDEGLQGMADSFRAEYEQTTTPCRRSSSSMMCSMPIEVRARRVPPPEPEPSRRL